MAQYLNMRAEQRVAGECDRALAIERYDELVAEAEIRRKVKDEAVALAKRERLLNDDGNVKVMFMLHKDYDPAGEWCKMEDDSDGLRKAWLKEFMTGGDEGKDVSRYFA